MSVTKKSPRIKPCKTKGSDSGGSARMTKHPLDEVSKVLLGKGMYQSFKPVGHCR